MFLFLNFSRILGEKRVYGGLNLLSCDDHSNTSLTLQLCSVELIAFTFSDQLGIEPLDTFAHLVSLGPIALDDLHSKSLLVSLVIRIQLVCQCVKKSAFFFWALCDFTKIKHIKQARFTE